MHRTSRPRLAPKHAGASVVRPREVQDGAPRGPGHQPQQGREQWGGRRLLTGELPRGAGPSGEGRGVWRELWVAVP